MLAHYDAMPTLAVRDLDAARAFYEGMLGLEPQGDSQPGTVLYRAKATTILVYVSTFAGTNQATAVNWPIPEGIEGLVERLAAVGIAFEHYQMPNMAIAGDLHVGNGMKIAWFKDPDGNIHALTEG